MRNAARLFTCASCRRQVVLCRRCDHGNIYCSQRCSDRAPASAQRLAGRRYQDSRRGRHKHARAPAALPRTPPRPGARRRARAQKVTHHPLTAARRRPVVARTLAGALRSATLRARAVPPGCSAAIAAAGSAPARSIRACARRERGEMAIDKQTRAEILRLLLRREVEDRHDRAPARRPSQHRRPFSPRPGCPCSEGTRRSKLDPFLPFIRKTLAA